MPKAPTRQTVSAEKNTPRGRTEKSRNARAMKSRPAANVGSASQSRRASSMVTGVAMAIPRITGTPRPSRNAPVAAANRRPASLIASTAAQGAARSQVIGPSAGVESRWTATTAEPRAKSAAAAMSSAAAGFAVTAAPEAIRLASASGNTTSRRHFLRAPPREPRRCSTASRGASVIAFARSSRAGSRDGKLAARRNAAKTSLASRVLPERLCELRRVEIGPQAVEKEQLRVGALPEQEVTQTLLAAGPDEQIDLGGHRIRMIYSGELPQILDTLIARRRAKTAACLRDAVSG